MAHLRLVRHLAPALPGDGGVRRTPAGHRRSAPSGAGRRDDGSLVMSSVIVGYFFRTGNVLTVERSGTAAMGADIRGRVFGRDRDFETPEIALDCDRFRRVGSVSSSNFNRSGPRGCRRLRLGSVPRHQFSKFPAYNYVDSRRRLARPRALTRACFTALTRYRIRPRVALAPGEYESTHQ